MENTINEDRKWTVLSSEYLIRRPWLTARRDVARLPDGRINNEYYVLEYPDWVNVIAITKDGQVVLERQYRHGLGKTCYELPCGVIEAGETPEAALRREIREELDTDIAVGKMLMRVQYDYPEFHLDMQCFWATVVAGDLRLKEHEAARWLPLADLWQVDWLPADRLVVEELNKEQPL